MTVAEREEEEYLKLMNSIYFIYAKLNKIGNGNERWIDGEVLAGNAECDHIGIVRIHSSSIIHFD